MTSLRHIKSWSLNCSNHYNNDVENSEIIRLCGQDCDAYAPLVAHIGNAYAKAQLYYTEQIINKPYNLSIVVPHNTDRKHKPQDPETMLERVIWFIENLRVPDCGLRVSLYYAQNMMSDFQGPFGWDTLWQTKQMWSNTNSSYITLQAHTEIDHNVGKSTHRINVIPSVEIIRRVATALSYNIIEVDYTTPINELYNLLLKSKHHFGYVGSSGYIAALTRTPTTFYGATEKPVHGFKTRYYDPHPEVYGKMSEDGLYEFPLSVWNNSGSNLGLTMQYSAEYNKMYLRNPDFYSISCNPDVIEKRTRQALLS